MDSIAVLVFLLRCSAGLLVCETMPSEHLRYAAMDTCRAEVAGLVSSNTGAGNGHVWMGMCLYSLAEADPRRTRRNSIYANTPFVQTADARR